MENQSQPEQPERNDIDVDEAIQHMESEAIMTLQEKNNKNLSSDISEWFNTGEEIKIFSDYEGTIPTSQMPKLYDIFNPNKNQKCIYLGDIFDNVNFKDKTIGENDEKKLKECIETKNYCALTMLQLFVNYPDKVKYVVGNRDINKIKVYPLLQFQDHTDKWWMDGNTYETIVANLLKKLYNNDNGYNSKFLINSMEFYIPFWKAKNIEGLDKICKPDKWTTEEGLKIYNLFDRYNKIFGQDCKEGTMSADYTIRGLPNELFYIQLGGEGQNAKPFDNILDSIKKLSGDDIISKISNTNDTIIIEKEIRAAIVFTVFMRMLDKDLWKEENIDKKMLLHEIGALDGYLYNYLSRAYPSFYAESKDKKILYLFAHGGITGGYRALKKDAQKLFLNSKENAFQILSKVNWANVLNINNTKFNNSLYKEDYYIKQDNVNIKNLTSNMVYHNCINEMSNFNIIYMQHINQLFEFFQSNTDKHTSKILLTLLSISAPVENNTIISNTGYTSDLSPIQPREVMTSELKTYDAYDNSKYDNVYNICGHSSSGMGGYGVKYLPDGTIFVNTDYSTSLFKDKLMCKKETEENMKQNYNSNNLMITLKNDGKLLLSGQISVPTSDISLPSDIKSDLLYTTIYYNNTQINNNTDIPELTGRKTIVYNGVGKINDNDKEYQIFSDFLISKDEAKIKKYLYVVPIDEAQRLVTTAFGGSTCSKKSKKSCKKKSCKNRNCKKHHTKKHHTKKNHTKKYKNSNKNSNNYKYKN